ncbi:MAG: aldo/keto reductase [Pseudomonadota bacterium]
MTQDRLSALTGKPASALAFGVMQWGGKADPAASRQMYDLARDAGITIFDAAYIYTEGRAEEMLGDIAKTERDALILISKCAYRDGVSGDDLKAQARESLRRLQTDRIDVLYLHRYPGDARLREALEAMRDLYAEGAFTCLGASNFAAWEVMKAQAVAEQVGAPPITVLQPMYNLVKRQAEVEILPMALREDLAVLPYSPLGGGLLTGKYSRGESGRLTEDDRYRARYAPSWMTEAAEGLIRIANATGIAPETLAVAWVGSHPAITAPIASASRPDQLAVSLAALSTDLSPELHAELSALAPTPPPATDRLEDVDG